MNKLRLTFQVFNTLKTNWRDLTSAILMVIGFSFLADLIVRWSSSDETSTWLVSVVSLLQGFAKFSAANLCLWFLGMAVAWPRLNGFGNEFFAEAWTTLTPKEKLYTFCFVACMQGIMAALCFSL